MSVKKSEQTGCLYGDKTNTAATIPFLECLSCIFKRYMSTICFIVFLPDLWAKTTLLKSIIIYIIVFAKFVNFCNNFRKNPKVFQKCAVIHEQMKGI